MDELNKKVQVQIKNGEMLIKSKEYEHMSCLYCKREFLVNWKDWPIEDAKYNKQQPSGWFIDPIRLFCPYCGSKHTVVDGVDFIPIEEGEN